MLKVNRFNFVDNPEFDYFLDDDNSEVVYTESSTRKGIEQRIKVVFSDIGAGYRPLIEKTYAFLFIHFKNEEKIKIYSTTETRYWLVVEFLELNDYQLTCKGRILLRGNLP